MAKKNEISVAEILDKKILAERERKIIKLDTKIQDYRRIIEVELDPKFVKYKKAYGRSCLNDPFLLSLVEFLVAEESVAIFGTEPFVGVEGFEESDVQGAKNMTNLLKQQFYKDVTYYTIVCWLIGAQTYPASVLKVKWDFSTGGPLIELCALENIYFSPASTGPLNKQIPWIIDESWQHIDDLKAATAEDGTPLYQNLDEVEENMAKGDEGKTASGTKIDKYTTEERKGMVHVLDFWKDDLNTAIANEKTKIIKDRFNPFEHGRKPFIVMNDWPRLMSPYGISTIEKCYDSYREIVTRSNQAIDNLSQGLNSGWYINEQANVDEDAVIEWDRGKIVRGQGPMGEAMSRLTPDLSNLPYAARDIEEKRRSLQDATHAYAYARGETPIRKETATGLSQLIAASSLVFRFKIMTKENIAIKELAAMTGALNQQYLPEDTIIRILGETGAPEVNKQTGAPGIGAQTLLPGSTEARHEKISRKDIEGRFDYIAKGSAVDPELGKPTKRAQMMQMMQFLVPAAQAAQIPPGFFFDFALLVTEQFDVQEATMLVKRYKKMREQMMQQMQAMQAAQQQQGGGQQMPGMKGGIPTPAQAGPEMGSPQAQMKSMGGQGLAP